MSTTTKLQLEKYADEIAYNGGNGAIVKAFYADENYKPSKQICGFICEMRQGAGANGDGAFPVSVIADENGKGNVTQSTLNKALAFFNREQLVKGKQLYEQSVLNMKKYDVVWFMPLPMDKTYPVERVFTVSGGDHCSKKAKTAKADADKQKAVNAVSADSKATIDAVKKSDSTTQADTLKAIADERSKMHDFSKIDVKRREDISRFCKSLSDDERAYLLSILADYRK